MVQIWRHISRSDPKKKMFWNKPEASERPWSDYRPPRIVIWIIIPNTQIDDLSVRAQMVDLDIRGNIPDEKNAEEYIQNPHS